jgi:succinate dehydrogenase/fumarate reductase flavoprotein subunit
MKPDGSFIPGLYAAGVMCSGWVNGTYCFFGSEMSFTIWSGRNAGMEASEYLKKKK